VTTEAYRHISEVDCLFLRGAEGCARLFHTFGDDVSVHSPNRHDVKDILFFVSTIGEAAQKACGRIKLC